MSSQSRPRRGARTIALDASVTVAHVSELKERFTKLLGRKTRVSFDFSEVERIDTAALQLLVTFVRAARERGVPLAWSQPPSAAMHEALQLVGLTDHLPSVNEPES